MAVNWDGELLKGLYDTERIPHISQNQLFLNSLKPMDIFECPISWWLSVYLQSFETQGLCGLALVSSISFPRRELQNVPEYPRCYLYIAW
jgi:hypothetical protein